MIKLKICGITNPKEAEVLDNWKVDFLGFTLSPLSPRCIKLNKAEPIIKSLNHAKSVGVFVQETIEEINHISKQIGLDLIQLHRQSTNEEIKQIKKPVIQVVSIGETKASTLSTNGEYLLFDTKIKHQIGGTGVSFNPKLLNTQEIKSPYFIAGGIGTENLTDFLTNFPNAYAFDLNSKVENSPGNKNLSLIEECLKILRK